MPKIRAYASRIAALFTRARRERDLAAELESHLALHIEDNLRAGMAPAEARRQALLKLGGLDQAKELSRDRRGIPWLENLSRDFRYGARMLRKTPGFTIVAVVSLALGIGANTAIFSMVNAMLLRPPAVEAPSRLLEFWNCPASRGCGAGFFAGLSYPDYLYYRDHNAVFSSVTAFDGDPMRAVWMHAGIGEAISTQLVAANFFSTLGVKMALGRPFSSSEESNGQQDAAIVLSHDFWQRRLGADRHVIGKPMIFNGVPYTVVGVAAADFHGVLSGLSPDFWVPLSMTVAMTHDPSRVTSRDTFWLLAIARLRPGASRTQAQANLTLLSSQLGSAFPGSDKFYAAGAGKLQLLPAPFRTIVGGIGGGLMFLVGLVLLIACANVTNLLLARAAARRREMAVRAALGASRARLMWQTMAESLLVSLGGALAALFLAKAALSAALPLLPPGPPLASEAPMDWRVLAFVFAVALATGLALGLAPALRNARVASAAALHQETSRERLQGSCLRNTLVVVQVAVCALLLVGAGLCLRSLWNANRIDLGFDGAHEAVARLDPGSLGLNEAEGRLFYRQLDDRLRATPGVTGVGRASFLPLAQGEMVSGIRLQDAGRNGSGRTLTVHVISASPGFFGAVGTPVLRGRGFRQEDGPGAPGVVVVNEALARAAWPGENPLGRRITFAGNPGETFQVVGIAKTVKVRTLGEEPVPVAYRSLLQFYQPQTMLVVRTHGDPRALFGAIRDAVHSVNSNIVPLGLETIAGYMREAMFPVHASTLLFGLLALLAVVLALTGLYAVVSYAVSRRTREIGIRVALGATHTEVFGLVIRQGAVLTLTGIGIGLAAAWALARFLVSLLYGVPPADPATFLAVAILLTLAGLAACYIPARRAARVDPSIALREE